MATPDHRLSPQEAKERAVKIAIRNLGAALVRRGKGVWAVYPNGSDMPVSNSANYDVLWHDALRVMMRVEAKRPRRRDRLFAWAMELVTRR